MRNQFHARNKSGTILKINPKIVDAANAAMKALGTCVILRVGLPRVCGEGHIVSISLIPEPRCREIGLQKTVAQFQRRSELVKVCL